MALNTLLNLRLAAKRIDVHLRINYLTTVKKALLTATLFLNLDIKVNTNHKEG
jgi:hypothetical protein